MIYSEFCEYLKEYMETRLYSEGEYYISLKTLKKNNDTPCKALVINKPSGEGEYSISPCIHLEPFWDIYTKNPSTTTLMQIVDYLYDSYKDAINNMPDVCKASNVATIRDYEKIKDSIVPCVVNSKWNQEVLADVPHRHLSDFSVIYRIMLSKDTSIIVNNKIMYEWNVSLEAVDQIALSNMESIMKPYTKNIYDILEEGKVISRDELPFDDGPEFYVIGNELGMFGASILANTDYLNSVSEELGGDFIIIPSSVQEILCLKNDDELDLEQLQDMIETVNTESVEVRDRLSDIPYIFDSKSCEVMRLSDYRTKKIEEQKYDYYAAIGNR